MSDTTDSFGRDFRWWAMEAAKHEARVAELETELADVANIANDSVRAKNRLETELKNAIIANSRAATREGELEAEVERQGIALSAAGMEKNALLAEKMAEVEKLRETLALVKSKTALDVVAENMEAQKAKRMAEAERDRLAEALREIGEAQSLDHAYRIARAALEGTE